MLGKSRLTLNCLNWTSINFLYEELVVI